MKKIITADTFQGQKIIYRQHAYHSASTEAYIYLSGFSTASNYPYLPWPMTFDGKLTKVNVRNNPYSSYSSGPTGSWAKWRVHRNGAFSYVDTYNYTAGNAGELADFEFSNATFSAGDELRFSFQSNGYWRYISVMMEFEVT